MTTPRTAAALLEARRDAGLTLRALESLTGVDYTHLSKLEHGHERPSLDTLAVILRACGWPVERITAVVMAERIGRVPDDVRAVVESEAATAALESKVEDVARALHGGVDPLGEDGTGGCGCTDEARRLLGLEP